MQRFLLSFILLVLVCGCHNNRENDDSLQSPPNTQEVNKELIPSQKMYIRQEADEISQYIKVHKYTYANYRYRHLLHDLLPW